MTYKIRHAEDIKSVSEDLWSQEVFDQMLAWLDDKLDILPQRALKLSWASFPRFRCLAGHIDLYKQDILKELCKAGYIAGEIYSDSHSSLGIVIEKLI